MISLYPGLVRTGAVVVAAAADWLDIANSERPEFSGRVIAALYSDPELMGYSGQAIIGAAAAARYGITDIDGRQLRPRTIETA